MVFMELIVEAVLVGVAVWLWTTKPKFENDDVSMPLGVAVSAFLANRASKGSANDREPVITLSRVLAVIVALAAVVWPVYAVMTFGL